MIVQADLVSKMENVVLRTNFIDQPNTVASVLNDVPVKVVEDEAHVDLLYDAIVDVKAPILQITLIKHLHQKIGKNIRVSEITPNYKVNVEILYMIVFLRVKNFKENLERVFYYVVLEVVWVNHLGSIINDKVQN